MHVTACSNLPGLLVKLDRVSMQDHRALTNLSFTSPRRSAGDHLDFNISFRLDDRFARLIR